MYVRGGRTVWVLALVLGFGFAGLALDLTASAQTVPVPAPRPLSTALTPSALPSAVPVPAPGSAGDPIGALIAQQQTPSLPMVIGMRLGEQQANTRIVVELSDPVQAKVFTLTGPDRVVIDLPEVLWRIGTEARPSGKGAVQSYRYGLFRQGNSRFVIDLAQPVRVDTPRLYPPEGGFGFRLVIDLLPTTATEFAAHSGWPKGDRSLPTGVAPAVVAALPPPAAPPPPPTPLPPSAKTPGQRIIVVDAGHGGIDPGTHGSTGLQEKDIVLAVAKQLRTALEGRKGYKVHLTRDTDVFIPLRERVNIARAAKGDLFVSLHIDFNDHHEIRGASIYTLSEEASDRESGKLAEKENMSDVIAGVDLSGDNSPVASILIDLAQRDTMNRSARFAETVLASLPSATLVRPTSPHRSAGFAVLKGPDIPAALVELGYLSNSKDEAEMGTVAWRKGVAEAIANAIDKHFNGDASVASRQAANP